MAAFVNQYRLGAETLYVFDDSLWIGPTPLNGSQPFYTRGGGLAGAQTAVTALPGPRNAGQVVLGVLMIVFFPLVAGLAFTPAGLISSAMGNAPEWVSAVVGLPLMVVCFALFVWLEIRVWRRPTIHVLSVWGPHINVQVSAPYKDMLEQPAGALRWQIDARTPAAA